MSELTDDQLERFAIEVMDIKSDAEAHRIWQAKIAAAKVRRKWGEALKQKATTPSPIK